MKKIINFIISATFVILAGGSTLAIASPVTVNAASNSCASSFLGFPAWYRGLTDGSCNIQNPTKVGGLQKFILIIALNCLEIAMIAAGYVALGFIIYGGYMFMVSMGEPAQFAAARKTVLDAIVGLIIVLAAVAIVQFISGAIT